MSVFDSHAIIIEDIWEVTSMKIGILGTGNITKVVAPTLAQLDEVTCYAVASRSLCKARDFAREFGFEKAYGSYEALLEDPEVELVYVATPHSHHFEYMMSCMKHNKPVICEKAFTINARQAAQIRDYSMEHKVFAAEAIWTRYMPSREIIQEVLDSGIIGPAKTLTANLAYPVCHRERLKNPALAGGALLDVGVYGLNFALMHFGSEIAKIDSSVQFLETGVDGMETITITYTDGRIAVITSGITARSDRQGIIWGEKGYLVVENINNPQSISIYDTKDNLLKKLSVPKQISGYEYEFQECVAAIQAGRTETWSMPLAESVHVMEVMDSLRREWGLIYPQERE